MSTKSKTAKGKTAKGKTKSNPPKFEDLGNDQPGEHDNRAPVRDGEIDETPRKLVTGGSFYKFEEEGEQFEGIYTGDVTASDDNPKMNQRKGDVIGYNFISSENDEEVIIPNNHAIRQAISQVKLGARLLITFQGAIKGKGGKPFKKFEVELKGYPKPKK